MACSTAREINVSLGCAQASRHAIIIVGVLI